MENNPATSRPLTPEERFACLLPQRLELAAILAHLPQADLPQMTMLDIGMPSPVMSKALRDCGGAWATIARSPAHAAEAAQYLGFPVSCLGADGTIPFETHVFDGLVVALDILAAMPDGGSFIKECNRVLKPSGLLILSAQAKRPGSLPDAVRRRRWSDPADPYSAAFTARDLYNFLKTGFDVLEVDGFSRFFVEFARLRELRLTQDGVPRDEVALRMRRRYAIAGALDRLLFWDRGHVTLLAARRRQWSSRITPTLRDGRRIGEAVLFQPPV